MKIDIFGTGYVGLTLALVLAKYSHSVKCWDIDENKIKAYKECKSDIREPFIDEMLREYQNNNNLDFDVYSKFKFIKTDLAIITIGTSLKDNSTKKSHEYLFKLVEELVGNNVNSILLRSTIEVGTCRKLNNKFGKKCNFIFAPERTIEGKAIEELLTLPQIAACINKESRTLVKKCFSPLGIQIYFSDKWEEAELAKLVCNVYRDYNFSFSNLLLRITNELSLDASKVIDLVSTNYKRMPLLKTGPVSGPCLTKDSLILSNSISDNTSKIILENARKINKDVIDFAKADIRFMANKLETSKLLFIGLTFKNNPFTTDTRESHSLELIRSLKNYFQCFIYDPYTDKDSRVEFDKYFVDDFKNVSDSLIIFCNNQQWVVDLYSSTSEFNKSIKYWLYKPPVLRDNITYCLGDHILSKFQN